MSISVFAVILIAILLLLTILAAGYFLLYTGNINQALAAKGHKHLHMIPPYKVVIALMILFVIGAVVLGVMYLPGRSRIATAQDMEEHLREFQAVKEDWNIEISMWDDFAAVIAYDDELSDHTFAVYRKDNDTVTNYVYRYGGHTTSVERSVGIYLFDDTLVLISMNALHIEKIQCHDGDAYELDPNRPFALILPNGGFDVYDYEGNVIDLEQDWWYEVREAD